MKLSSPAFSDGGPIARAHTCDGADMSPPLVWEDVPEGTESFALVVDDPDAPGGTFVHWVMYAIDSSASGLPSGVPIDAEVTTPISALQGTNDFRRIGYGGPCPPPGPAHGYVFKLYALDSASSLPSGASKPVLLEALKGHVLEEARLLGKYGRGS